MDIIIRNGVIQNDESKRITEIKNEMGLLKKDYKNYIKGIPGPYYDLFDSHLCIPRRYNQIKNFSGPQSKKNIKLKNNKNFNKLVKYCCICHSEIIPNKCFSTKRKIFIEEDDFVRKVEHNFDLHEHFKKIKIDNNNDNINLITNKLNKTSLDIFKKWNILYYKIYNIYKKNNLNSIFENYKNTQEKIIKKYYQIIYKLTKTPLLYPISTTETKLIWPWDLTKYQKFRLNNPDYRLNPMFGHRKNNKIVQNYVIIE